MSVSDAITIGRWRSADETRIEEGLLVLSCSEERDEGEVKRKEGKKETSGGVKRGLTIFIGRQNVFF